MGEKTAQTTLHSAATNGRLTRSEIESQFGRTGTELPANDQNVSAKRTWEAEGVLTSAAQSLAHTSALPSKVARQEPDVPPRNKIESRSRDFRIDALRGFFLLIMTIDHLPAHPLTRLTWQTFGFVSVAEGFVFVSGLVSGLVYGRILLKQGEEALRHRAWHRARDIYLTHLLLYTLALIASRFGGRAIGTQFGFLEAWWRGALLIYRPRLFAILPMYAIFLFLTPLILQLMARRRTLLVWAVSLALWLAAQKGLGSEAENPQWLQLGFFNILAWQILFIAGTYFGFSKASGRISPILASRRLFWFSVALATILFLARHNMLLFVQLTPRQIDVALQRWKSDIHPLRLLNFAVFAYIFWFLPRSIDERLHQWAPSRVLAYVGSHSLQVYAWSVVVSYTAASFRPEWIALPPSLRALLAVGAALTLVFPAWVHERWRRNRRVPSQSPALAN